jgi:hypothetical protein
MLNLLIYIELILLLNIFEEVLLVKFFVTLIIIIVFFIEIEVDFAILEDLEEPNFIDFLRVLKI